MSLNLSDLDFKYLQKKMCCRTCHQSVINIFKQLETSSDIIKAREQLLITMNQSTLSNDVEQALNLLIKEKNNASND